MGKKQKWTKKRKWSKAYLEQFICATFDAEIQRYTGPAGPPGPMGMCGPSGRDGDPGSAARLGSAWSQPWRYPSPDRHLQHRWPGL